MEVVEDERVKVTLFADQNLGETMEDAYTISTDFGGGKHSLICVFDGHAGSAAARFCAKYLPLYLERNRAFVQGDYAKSLHQVLMQMDRLMRSKTGSEEMANMAAATSEEAVDGPGTCAVVVLVTNSSRIFVANVGDCHCSLFRYDSPFSMSKEVVYLTKPHHCRSYPAERERVLRAGGTVVHATLQYVSVEKSESAIAMSRALGDFQFKMNENVREEEQVVTSVPDIVEVEICSGCLFLVVGSDGFLMHQPDKDVVGTESYRRMYRRDWETCNEIHSALKSGSRPLEELLSVFRNPGLSDGDNRTLAVVELKQAWELESGRTGRVSERFSWYTDRGKLSDSL